jgi:hypothetical protein
MRALYGFSFRGRYRALAELVPADAEVFEACAGDAYLYQHFLKPKGVRYQGGDLNAGFVEHARRRGIAFVRHDLMRDPIPSVDYVVLQASLYQFMPDEHTVVDKLLQAARKAVIIAEPIRNLASSRSRLVRAIARSSANPGDGHKGRRFDERSLDAFFQTYFASDVLTAFQAPGGREKVYCLRGRA